MFILEILPFSVALGCFEGPNKYPSDERKGKGG